MRQVNDGARGDLDGDGCGCYLFVGDGCIDDNEGASGAGVGDEDVVGVLRWSCWGGTC